MSTSDDSVIDDGRPQEVVFGDITFRRSAVGTDADVALKNQAVEDLAARLRTALVQLFVPGVPISAADVSRTLQHHLDLVKHDAVDNSVKVTVDPDDPIKFRFTCKLWTQTLPQYRMTFTRPADMSDAEWAKMCSDLREEVERINAEHDAESGDAEA